MDECAACEVGKIIIMRGELQMVVKSIFHQSTGRIPGLTLDSLNPREAMLQALQRSGSLQSP